MTVDLDSIRSFLAWDLSRRHSTDTIVMREYLISLVVAVEQNERRLALIRSLGPHWRAAALGAETVDEHDTWILAAEQLDAAFAEELQP